MTTLAIIPARYASTRFPGKPLVAIAGRPMIEWVYRRSLSCEAIDEVLVATDDQRIADACHAFGAKAMMTSSHHLSGTDRIAEALEKSGSKADLIINVQGDEPTIDPAQLSALIACFQDPSVDIATLVCPIKSIEDLRHTDRVKAIRAASGRALYFTRSAAPHDRSDAQSVSNCYQHIGVYAYRADVLREICKLAPSPLEKKESLEQLRWLEAGKVIHTVVVESAPPGVDRPQDVTLVERLLNDC